MEHCIFRGKIYEQQTRVLLNLGQQKKPRMDDQDSYSTKIKGPLPGFWIWASFQKQSPLIEGEAVSSGRRTL